MQDQVDKSMIAKIMSSILIGIVMKDYAFEHNPPDDEIEGGGEGEGEGVVFISQENHQQISSVLTQFLLQEIHNYINGQGKLNYIYIGQLLRCYLRCCFRSLSSLSEEFVAYMKEVISCMIFCLL